MGGTLHLADVIVSLALGGGVPAIVGVLWKIHGAIERLGVKFDHLEGRVSKLESNKNAA